jgi:hypothetical protein
MPKGIYDRAASAWRPKPKKEYDPALVERVRDLYEAGHTMREVAELCGVSVKVLQTLMPRHGIARRSTAKRNQRGPANHMWKGDAAGYQALHLRVEAERGKPAYCTRCGVTGGDGPTRYEWANLTGDYADVSDYARMCVPCHRGYDADRRRLTGERTSPRRGGDGNV